MRPTRFVSLLGLIVLVGVLALPAIPAGAVHGGDTLVSVGSPPGPFAQNKQNEPAIAVDPAHPNVLAAGSNDEIDLEACSAGDPTTCPFTAGIGVSGIYFSLDSGDSWVQPTYTGLTARDCLGPAPCSPHVGDIGTLPLYYENGLVSNGDPALAFGPMPDSSGNFSWSNGSRLYYANLAGNLSTTHDEAVFKGPFAVAVSRTDDVGAAAAGDDGAWMAPVIVTKQSATTFSDKEQIGVDDASSSPFFGNVYVCNASFRSSSRGHALPQPLIVGTSTDGGSTWTLKQVTPASNNPFNTNQGFGRSGCTVRTDSNGVVYVFATQFAAGLPGHGFHIMIKSYDGGKSWTKAQKILPVTDGCNAFDALNGRCTQDGIAGARNDLLNGPSVSIANGAPDGSGATNVIYDSWVDGVDGLNNEKVMVSYSTNGGATWSAPQDVTQSGDRGYYSAIALSPDGTDAYLVYNAFTTPYQNDTTTPRGLVGVVLHSDIGLDGAPTGWSEIHRGVVGDPRGSSQNGLISEFLGDYVYAAATRDYGAAVWNDVRNAADCPAIDAWRYSIRTGGSVLRPSPNTDCPATFGNSDIFGGSFADPTP